MLSGVEPLRERLTFFWHNHFATSINKVTDPKLMQGQYELMRKHALGKFGPYLREMSRDAAMLMFDAQRRRAPRRHCRILQSP